MPSHIWLKYRCIWRKTPINQTKQPGTYTLKIQFAEIKFSEKYTSIWWENHNAVYSQWMRYGYLVWVYRCLTSHATIFQSYMWRHRCAGGLKKLYLWAGSKRHRHFVRFFNGPVLHRHGATLFYGYSEKTPNLVAFYDAGDILGYKNTDALTVAPTIEHQGGHSRTPANQRWDQVPGRSHRLLLG